MPAACERRVLTTEFEVRNAPDGHTKIIEGYAAKFNRYSDNLGGFVESIRPGAFSRALADPEILGKFEHTSTLARTGAGTLRVSEDSEGLAYEMDINMADPEGVSVLAKVERGDVHKSSFAFTITHNGDEWGETDQNFPLREIVSVARLFDVSVVSTPAYPDTDSKVALRSFAAAYDVPANLVEAAAESGDLIELIRGARNLAPEILTPDEIRRQESLPTPPEQRTAVAPVVSVRIEIERMEARRRAAARAALLRP